MISPSMSSSRKLVAPLVLHRKSKMIADDVSIIDSNNELKYLNKTVTKLKLLMIKVMN